MYFSADQVVFQNRVFTVLLYYLINVSLQIYGICQIIIICVSISTLKWASYSDEKSTKNQKNCNFSKYCCFGVSITVSEDFRNKIEMNEITRNKYRVSHSDMVISNRQKT